MEEERVAPSATQFVCPICAEHLLVEGQFGRLVHLKCPPCGWTWVGEPRAGHGPLSLSPAPNALGVDPHRVVTPQNIAKEASGRCAS